MPCKKGERYRIIPRPSIRPSSTTSSLIRVRTPSGWFDGEGRRMNRDPNGLWYTRGIQEGYLVPFPERVN